MVFLAISLIIVALVVIVIIKTYTFPFQKINPPGEKFSFTDISENSIRRFAEGLKIPTVSSTIYEETNFEPFDQFKTHLLQAYPEIYRVMETYTVNGYGLVFRWKGNNPKLNPILFLSHYDVVPPGDDPNGPEGWEYPPFSGAIADGKIHGRGAIDMKGMLFGILEAADQLISEGFTPERDIWFAFGHDEEVGGVNGAAKIVEDFGKKKLTFDAVYDEGGIIAAKGFISQLSNDVALVGVAEKGYVTFTISVKGSGGHSSMPPLQTALGQAAVIMQRLEDNQMEARLIPPVKSLLANIGGAMDFSTRMAIANQWLFKSLLIKSLSRAPSTNALIRTTTALTMAKGSDASNVLPTSAEITVNFRTLPGDMIEDVKKHVEKACKGFDVDIHMSGETEASKISGFDTEGFDVMKQALAKIYPDALVTPYLSVTGSDAPKYESVCPNIYRLIPVRLTSEEQETIHNLNESISIENYRKMIAYFREVMMNYN